ncbi:/ / hypothetical protein / 451731:452933 Reverse [Candidatus Hepatoplasma crinochetorum]|uniref:Uncharacterized protein n=1 Tax=Candidatus Hepatoplasma crinochetorum TaxID=295596 RepID=A0A0G7ZLC3_9MOLU|nr:/ / hypothetical protein / 451731:452933 Reverse [Candidatus Hepatoplasma crinochetorum]
MWHYFKTLLKQYLKSPFTYISIIFPIAFLFGLGQIVPISYIYATTVSITIIMIAFFLFGGTILEIRKTSMIKSMSLTNLSKTRVFSINILISFLFTSIVIFIITILVFAFTLSGIDFLATDWTFWSDQKFLSFLSGDIYWEDVKWGLYIYSLLLGIILAYGLAFLLISLSKSSTTLYLWSFFYLLLFIFGTYTSIPNFFVFGKSEDVPGIEFLLDLRYIAPNYYSNQTMTIALSNDATYNFVTDLLIDSGLKPEQAQFITDHIFNSLGNVQNWDWDNLITDAQTFTNATRLNVADQTYLSDFFNQLKDTEVTFLGNETSLITVFKNVEPLSNFLKTLFTEPVERWLKFFIDPFVLFDITNKTSIIYSFTPLIMVVIFLGIGVRRFEWSIR